MPGPIPKPAASRKRRNKTAGARTLTPGVHAVVVRELPERDPDWLSQTRAWWADLWASPMAPEYDESDLHGLLLLASLIDSFWRFPEKQEKLAAEIRQQRQCFGLSPLDRRRLQWEIERGDSAAARTGKRREQTAPQPEADVEDPRRLLA